MGPKALLSGRKRHASLNHWKNRKVPAAVEIHPGIYRITLPLPGKKPGPINTYLFTRDPVTIIDTGTSVTAPLLRAEINRIGLDFTDIKNIVLTHGHIDHFGAALIIKNESGAKVFASTMDKKAIEKGSDVSAITFLRFLIMVSVPFRFLFALWTMMLLFRSMARTCTVDVELKQGDVINLGGYYAEVLETPGHTKGSLCFFIKDAGILFSGDHILSHITPNAFVMLEDGSIIPSRKSQNEYYQSLEKVENYNPVIVHPAHGPSIENLGRITSLYRKSFVKRQDLILKIIGSGKNDVYSIARRLFPVVDKKILVLETYLMVSEVFTHLQVLEEEGRVWMERRSGRIFVSISGEK
jgi:glyoxylase-like metal-dependent hydrolase (beta-lactamase superfamily II)